MVKAYLRYEQRDTFGVVASPNSNIIYDASGALAITSALERVSIWNIKQGSLVQQLKGSSNDKAEVTCLTLSDDGKYVAVGYEDGNVRVWELSQGDCIVTLHGHKGAITALAFNSTGTLLASGSRDTDIVVWDIVGESGLYRLRGHKSEVTALRMLRHSKHIISSSKDTFVKFWDMDTQFCVHTIVGHRNEVWSFDVDAKETRMITGSSDGELRVFILTCNDAAHQEAKDFLASVPEDEIKRRSLPSSTKDILAVQMGSLARKSRQRTVMVRFNPRGTLLACQNADKTIELFQVRDRDSIKKRMKRRAARQREKINKQAASGNTMNMMPDGKKPTVAVFRIPEDEFAALHTMRTSKKIRSFCFCPTIGLPTRLSRTELAKFDRIMVSHHNNSAAVYDMKISTKIKADDTPYTKVNSLGRAGHRAGVRSLALSHDDNLLLSTSNDQLKVWNLNTRNCIRTLDSGYGLCSLFAPGSRHALVGTKEGNIEIWDIGAATLVQKIKAHDGPVWSMDLRPDSRGIATGGGDKELKFWEFELVSLDNSPSSAKQLSLLHTRTLKLTDDILCVKHSADGKLIAVGLLDATIKLFYEDSLQFFVSLYGHKLPVLSIDISSDSTLLISGSADKNVRIWGMDFGDCHKSLFAHQDFVMGVKFVPDTHYFFSIGKDRALNYWDADKFEQIMSLPGYHHAEVWGLAVANAGNMVVTSGNDRSIRLWEETDEMLFLEEEREKKLQELFDEDALIEQKMPGAADGSGLVEEKSTAVVNPKGKASMENLKAGEKIMEILDIATDEEARWDKYNADVRQMARRKLEHRSGLQRMIEEASGMAETLDKEVARPAPNIYLRGRSVDQYVLDMLLSIRRSHLEEALMVLPFDYAVTLIKYLQRFIETSQRVELAVRCALFLISIHQNQIVANSSVLQSLVKLKRSTRERLQQQKDMIGFNLAALRMLQRQFQDSSNAYFFGDRAKSTKTKSIETGGPKTKRHSGARKRVKL
jgi:U3 small nucleolar RNA-associated protein 12